MTYSEVDKVDGYIGNFTVTVRKKARGVKEADCNGCGDCAAVCPVTKGNEFDLIGMPVAAASASNKSKRP